MRALPRCRPPSPSHYHSPLVGSGVEHSGGPDNLRTGRGRRRRRLRWHPQLVSIGLIGTATVVAIGLIGTATVVAIGLIGTATVLAIGLIGTATVLAIGLIGTATG